MSVGSLFTPFSAAIGMGGAQASAAAAQAASNYNAIIKQQQADMAIAQSQENERRQRIQGKLHIGGMRAGLGASGVTSEGSPLDVLEFSASNSELDALTIRHGGQLKAWAYRAGANLDLFTGRQAKSKGDFDSASALISSLSGATSGMSLGGGGGGGEEGGGEAMAGEGDVSAAAMLA